MIEVDTLSRRYGPLLALDRVSFRVGRGEVLGFLGPNGAGKTTTMKIITGYLAPTSGEVRVSGRRVSGRDGEFRDRLGYLPESAPAYPEMRVGDYLRFVARLRGIARRERAARVDEALDRCGLGAMRGREIRALSKGYRQRVGLAQAIVHDPDVLVLDEPTSGLDPNQVVEIRALIRALGREKTIIFSSHVLAEVQAVATRVVILGRGRIVADGSPAALTGRGALRVTVDDPAAVVRLLGGVPGVAAARVVDGEVEVSAAEDVRAAVARAVVEAGHALLGLRPADDLEAVFRRLTEESR
ncbi:MAG: ATP-binding cassette domain-containing protein [Myxococcales bacterium]|nr:ATP-binding cassette domain-containing protein [Myxococcales bacterium]MCB9542557.1 ATP-binding cassette domain-containing protein [Myxococcales bacterium]